MQVKDAPGAIYEKAREPHFLTALCCAARVALCTQCWTLTYALDAKLGTMHWMLNSELLGTPLNSSERCWLRTDALRRLRATKQAKEYAGLTADKVRSGAAVDRSACAVSCALAGGF